MYLYVTRIGEMFRKKVRTQDLADPARWDALKGVVNPSDNFENLFEIPVLFYVALLVIYVTQLTDPFYVGAGWAFVALRCIHSFIHCTYNRIMHRFIAYALSSFILWALWLRLTWQLFAAF